MVRSTRKQFGRFLTSLVVVAMLISMYPLGVSAQDGEPTTGPGTIFIPLAQGDAAGDGVEVPTPTDEQVLEAAGVRETARSIMPPASAQVTLDWLDEPPVLTAAQMATAEAELAMTHLPGPEATKAEDLAPLTTQMAPETQSFVQNSVELDAASVDPSSEKEMLAPTAPGDAWLYRNVAPVTTGGSKSNVMEASTAQGGAYAFYTGNWFAARSITGGSTWSYVNPYADMSDFCCDQVTLYDESRNLLFWYRQSSRQVRV
ncbi:MAG: hypothetical protein IPK16_21935 [Anaerolineales bacterium]|nr:hypothetical protein [Anaerolineales bacterium]